MYLFDNYLTLRETAGVNMETADIRVLWVMTGSSAATVSASGLQGEPSAAHLSSFSNILECDWSGYARKQVTGRDVAIDTTSVPHVAQITHDPIGWEGLITGDDVVGAIWFIEGASEALRIPLLFFDGGPTFPITPSGGSVWLLPDTNGSVSSSI